MKDSKILLKEAREALKNKNYEVSLKISKTILRDDKANYMALLFLGLSLQEVGPTEQAVKAFRKAIELNPSNPLAWNGIINYFEKLETDDAKVELVKAYRTILELETSPKKIIEYIEKLTQLSKNSNTVDIIEHLSDKFPDIKCDLYEIILKTLDLTDVSEEVTDKYEKYLIEIISTQKYRTCEYYLKYLSLLYKQCRYEELVEHAEKMHAIYDRDSTSLNWVCKIFNQLFVEHSDLFDKFTQSADRCSNELLKIEENNAMALFTKSIFLLKENKLIEARDKMIEVTKQRPGLLHAWVLLASLYAKLKLFDEAIIACNNADKLLKSINDSNKLLRVIVEGLQIEVLSCSDNEDNWNKVIEFYSENIAEYNKFKHLKDVILAHINLKKFDVARILINDLESKDIALSKFLTAKCLHREGNIDQALSILTHDTTTENPDWWIELGLLYWAKGEHKQCLMPFLKAAKLDANNYMTFIHLGDYYQTIMDFDKARRCYEKAFKINPKSQNIVTKLSKIYCQQKNWVASHNLLESLTTGIINKENSWAWMQLGLSYLEQENYTNAVDKLRIVLRIDNDNVHCWESLGDAYLGTGSYTSALKCYQKSLERTNNPLYASLQIANIHKILGLYTEARSDFERILQAKGQYVPALKGLAETCIYQARQCFRDQRLGTARDHIQSAVDNLTLAVQQRSEFSCLWKLLGDSCLFAAKLPEKYSCLFITTSLIDGRDVTSDTTMIEKEEILNCCTRFYSKSINLTEDNVLIWHDLGVSYLTHSLHTNNVERKEPLLSYALAVAQHCTNVNPSNWQHWNLLGNIAMNQDPPNYAAAQHAYIKAVTVDHNCTVAWTNLGILYLLTNDIGLANKSFSQGQRSDPEYVNSWIGQALIAEALDNEEAMDLFRHSTQLGQHQQGGIGYAHWVCRTLLRNIKPGIEIYSIHKMHAIAVACDALTWYTEKNPYDGCAWNMLGILRERMGLKSLTLAAYKNAYRLCDKQQRDQARINYGRMLAKLENFTSAIKVFQEVQEATFNSGSGLALALFKDKQYEESYSAYEQALHWLTDEQSNQSELLVALASMAYMFQDAGSAKTLLFQSIQLKPPSPWGLYATLSLGLLHEDKKLSKLVLNELEALKDKEECLAHYAVLLSYFLLLQNEGNRAVVEISKLIHRHPNNAAVWLNLSILLLRVQKERKPSLAAAKCAQVAMTIGKSNIDVTKVLGLVALSSLLAGELKSSIKSAQKAVHCYPNIADGWAVLSVSLLQEKSNTYPKSKVKSMLQHVQDIGNENIKEWTRKLCI